MGKIPEKNPKYPNLNVGGTNKGGPGRPKGSVSLTTELKRQLSEGAEVEDVVKATLLNAKEGNAAALKIVWDRIDGPIPLIVKVEEKSDEELLELAAGIINRRESDSSGSS